MCVAVLLVMLVAAELMLRLFLPVYFTGYVGAYQYDAEVGAILKPGGHHLKTTDYQQEIFTNTLGTVNFERDFSGYRRKIFAIGDSFTQGTGLPADASYPFQLNLQLNMREGVYRMEYAVINLGLSAFGSEQATRMLQRYAARIGKPDYILYLGCNNDYMDDIKFRKGLKHRHLIEGNPYWGILLKPLMWFKNDTEIGKRFYFAVDRIRLARLERQDLQERGTQPENQERREPECAPAGSVAFLHQPALDRVLALSREMDATLIVSWANWQSGGDGDYAHVQNWARANGVAFADYQPAVRSVVDSIPGLPLSNPHSGGHYRTWANALIAQAFANCITGPEPIEARSDDTP